MQKAHTLYNLINTFLILFVSLSSFILWFSSSCLCIPLRFYNCYKLQLISYNNHFFDLNESFRIFCLKSKGVSLSFIGFAYFVLLSTTARDKKPLELRWSPIGSKQIVHASIKRSAFRFDIALIKYFIWKCLRSI